MAAAAGLLALVMPGAEAVDGTLSVWHHGFRAQNFDQPFYQSIAGLDDWPANLGMLLTMAAGSVAVLAPAAWIAWRRRERGGRLVAVAVAVGAFCALLFAASVSHFPWDHWLLPLPLWLAVMLVTDLRGSRAEADPVVGPGLAGCESEFLALAEWTRERTPREALFLVPPDSFAPFRLYARRSVVVTLKEGTFYEAPAARR